MVSVWKGFLFHWVLGMGYVILLWHSLSLPYNYFTVGITQARTLMVAEKAADIIRGIDSVNDFEDI